MLAKVLSFISGRGISPNRVDSQPILKHQTARTASVTSRTLTFKGIP